MLPWFCSSQTVTPVCRPCRLQRRSTVAYVFRIQRSTSSAPSDGAIGGVVGVGDATDPAGAPNDRRLLAPAIGGQLIL